MKDKNKHDTLPQSAELVYKLNRSLQFGHKRIVKTKAK